MALFGRKKSSDSDATPQAATAGPGDSAAGTSASAAGGGFEGDPRKARRFFEHAETVAEAKNFDYAIEMYINGLRHDPDNMAKHEALYEVAKRRKVAGGKPAGLREKLKSSGPDAVSKMVDAEKLWAMNFIDPALATEFFKRAVEADEAEPDLMLGEVGYWVGSIALEFANQKPKTKSYVTLRDLFARIGKYDKAIEACKRAIRTDMNNAALLSDLKNLEAEAYAANNAASKGEGNFRENVKDAEHAATSAAGDTRAVSAVDQAIARRRAEYEENPEDIDRLTKLVDALLKKETYDEEAEAIKLLELAHQQSGQYRFKVRAGDVKMKQFNRDLRELRKNLAAAPTDDYFQGRYKDTLAEKLTFELAEYEERVSNYPTDLKLKFELGKRMYQAGNFDEAIGLLQQAKSEPKSRAQAHMLLGRCFLEKGWSDEAIDTLAQGIEAHPIADDALGKELRYDKLIALMASAEKNSNVEQAEEANKLASELLQSDINYKDIKQQKQAANDLLEKLRAA